jgi:hypothetical protein
LGMPLAIANGAGYFVFIRPCRHSTMRTRDE